MKAMRHQKFARVIEQNVASIAGMETHLDQHKRHSRRRQQRGGSFEDFEIESFRIHLQEIDPFRPMRFAKRINRIDGNFLKPPRILRLNQGTCRRMIGQIDLADAGFATQRHLKALNVGIAANSVVQLLKQISNRFETEDICFRKRLPELARGLADIGPYIKDVLDRTAAFFDVVPVLTRVGADTVETNAHRILERFVYALLDAAFDRPEQLQCSITFQQ